MQPYNDYTQFFLWPELGAYFYLLNSSKNITTTVTLGHKTIYVYNTLPHTQIY